MSTTSAQSARSVTRRLYLLLGLAALGMILAYFVVPPALVERHRADKLFTRRQENLCQALYRLDKQVLVTHLDARRGLAAVSGTPADLIGELALNSRAAIQAQRDVVNKLALTVDFPGTALLVGRLNPQLEVFLAQPASIPALEHILLTTEQVRRLAVRSRELREELRGVSLLENNHMVTVVLLTLLAGIGWMGFLNIRSSRRTLRALADTIVERDAQAQVLRVSELGFRVLFEQAAVGMISGTPDGTINRINRRLCAMLGYTPEEIKKLGAAGFSHPDDMPQDFALFAKLVAGEIPFYQLEKRYLHKDGRIVWGHLTLGSRLENGRIVEISGIIQDITERKQAEEQLQLDHQIIANINDGVHVVRISDGTIVFANRRTEEMFGYAPDELLGRYVTVLNAPDEKNSQETSAAIMAELHAHDIWRGEILNRRKDGSVFWCEASVTALSEKNSRHGAVWVSVHRDITGRKRQEDELRIKESAMASAITGFSMSSLDEKIIYSNAAWLRMHGYEAKAEVIGTSPFERVESPADALAIMAAIKAQGHWSGELMCKRRDGSIFPADLACTLVTNTAGQPLGLLGSFQDITERKRAETAIRSSEARLRAILDTSPVPMALNDAALRITYLNPAFTRTLGYAHEDIPTLADWWPKAYPDPTYRQWVEESWQVELARAAETGTAFTPMELKVRCKDGTERFLLASAASPGGSFGDTNVVVLLDITDQKRAEEARKQNEQRLEEAQRIGHIGSLDWNIVTNKIVLSRETLRIFGLDESCTTFALEEIASRLHPADRDRVERSLSDAAQGIAPHDMEHRMIRPDGTIVDVHVTAELFRDSAGHPVRLLGTVLDTTRTKQLEKLRSESELRLNEAQRLAKIGSWELAPATGILHWSDEIFHLFEIDPAKFDATYEAFLHAIHPDDRDMVNAAYTGSLKDRKPYRITHRLRMHDGRIKFAEEQCETDFEPDGTPLQSRGTVQDVTESVLAERALQASLREKTTLLQEIHHRVKNNLQVVSSLLYFEQRRADDPAVAAQFQRSHNRVAAISLVHERLYQSPDLAGINFAGYADTLGRQILHLQEFSGRAGPVTLRVEGDGFKLGVTEAVPCALILNELLTNSLKHAFPAGAGGTVTIRLETTDDGARHVWFADDGAGLPEGALPAGGRSFGLRLIEQLTEQLQATFVREPAAKGLHVHLTIPPPITTP